MKKLLIFVLFFISAGTVYAEGGLTPGCTDPTASNYNANAQSDNGSCVGGQENANVQQIQANNAQRSTSQPSSGSGFVALAPIPGLTDTSALSAARSTNLASFFNNLYKFAIGMAAVLAVIQIIWGGIEIATNKDNVSKIIDSKGRILQAVLGLVLVLSPVLVFSIINPSILNLSINLPELDTRSGPPTGTGTSPTVTTDPATGCSVTGGDYFKTAVCQSRNAASSFNCGSSGLSLRVPSCRNLNPQGTCLDTSFTAYCAGKTTTLTYYSYYRGSGAYKVIFITGAPVIPRDSPARDTFVNSCTSQGGRVTVTATAATNARMATRAWVVANGCPDDSGIVIDTAQHPGAACFTFDISCDPPN